MSIWANVDGKIQFKKNPHFSLKKALNSIVTEFTIDQDQFFQNAKGDYTHYVRFSYCADGEFAASIMRFLIRLIRDADENATFDFNTNIRYLS